MENDRAGLFRFVNTGDGMPFVKRSCGVAAGCHDDTNGRFFAPHQIGFRKATFCGFEHDIEQTAFQSGDHTFRFRIAEADIEFQNFRTVFCDHDPGIDDAAVIHIIFLHTGKEAFQNRFCHFIHDGFCHHRSGGVCTHTAGIGPHIIIEETFVVLRTDQGDNGFAIGESEDGCFFADEQFFDHNNGTGIAELTAKAIADRLNGFRFIGGNDHTFTGGKTVSFDHCFSAGGIFAADIGFCFRSRSEGLIAGSGDTVTDHELFGEIFTAFQTGRCFYRTENGDPDGTDGIGGTVTQRSFRADDR